MGNQWKYAGFWRRFFASSLDGFILALIGFGISLVLGRNPFEQSSQIDNLLTLDYLLTFLVGAAYVLIFWVNYGGQTPGKRALHIKVVKEGGAPLDWGTAIIRYFSYFVSIFSLYIGYLWVIFDPKKQAWHDKIAKTYVVEADEKKPSKLVYLLPIALILLTLLAVGAIIALAAIGKIQERNAPINVALRKSASAAKDLSPEVKKHWDRSQELFSQMKAEKDTETVRKFNDENISELKQAIEAEPNNARIWVELGAAYTWVSTKGSLEDSYLAYKKASDLEPDNIIYNNYVGDALIALGKYEEAILILNKTIRVTDKSSFAYQSLGIAYERLKVYDQARTNYQKALEGFQKDNDKGQFDQTILEIQKALARLPKL